MTSGSRANVSARTLELVIRNETCKRKSWRSTHITSDILLDNACASRYLDGVGSTVDRGVELVKEHRALCLETT
jgi:hypothetical protein